MANVAIGTSNYNDPDFYASFTYSSQQTVAPATNLGEGIRRSKVWRSGGYYEVTSANKGIVLQTTAGVNQTVNIAEATYTTDASFLAAIDTALTSETSGAAFTVTRDTTTNAIKITSDGAGGTIFRLMCTNASFTAASLMGFSTGADLTGALTYTADTNKICTSEWLKWDFGSATAVYAVILGGLRNTNFKITAGATVYLQGNATDSWGSPSYSTQITFDDYGGMLIDTTTASTLSALGTYRYWRILINDTTNALGYVELSSVYIGAVTEPTQGKVQFPIDTELVDYGTRTISRSGVSYHDIVQVSEILTIKWQFLSLSEKEALEDYIRDVGMAKPFWIILDPMIVFSGSNQRNVRFVKFESTPKFTYNVVDQWDSSWQLREEV
jgi:hypothetical protein